MTDTSTQKDQNQPKRDRSSNFTNNEQTLLLRLANLKKNVIENHRTDGQSNTAKDQEWKNIERSFNAENLGTGDKVNIGAMDAPTHFFQYVDSVHFSELPADQEKEIRTDMENV